MLINFSVVYYIIFFYLYYFLSILAFINESKSGCGLVGLLLNSGWNWLAIKCGWVGISTISTKLFASLIPEKTKPFCSNNSLYSLLN